MSDKKTVADELRLAELSMRDWCNELIQLKMMYPDAKQLGYVEAMYDVLRNWPDRIAAALAEKDETIKSLEELGRALEGQVASLEKMRSLNTAALAEQKAEITKLNESLDSITASAIRQSAEIEFLEEKLRLSETWPLVDVVKKLIHAAVLGDERCDFHGHEEIRACIDAGKEWVEKYYPETEGANDENKRKKA